MIITRITSYKPSMALNSFFCADVPLRNYSLITTSRCAKHTASSPLFTIEGMLENTCIFVANVRSSCALSLSFTITIVDTLQNTLYSSSRCEEHFASSPPFTKEDTLENTLYSCSRCEKRFCFISTVHNSRHTAEHLYSCIRCEDRFALIS